MNRQDWFIFSEQLHASCQFFHFTHFSVPSDWQSVWVVLICNWWCQSWSQKNSQDFFNLLSEKDHLGGKKSILEILHGKVGKRVGKSCFSAFCWGDPSTRALVQWGYSPYSKFISEVSFFLWIDLATVPGSCRCCSSACFLFLPSNFYSWSINLAAAAVWDAQQKELSLVRTPGKKNEFFGTASSFMPQQTSLLH